MPKILKHVLFILLPLVGAFAILPSVYGNHLLLFNFMIFIMLAQGVNVIYGFTGYLPFGYAGFFGAGAYGFSLMVIHLHTPPLLALPAGALAALVSASLDPAVSFVGRLFRHCHSRSGSCRVAGNIESQPRRRHQGSVWDKPERSVQSHARLCDCVTIFAATNFLVIYLRNSQFGMALQAIREDPISAAMAGIDVVRARIIAWLLSALIAGFAGSIFAWYVSVFYPETVFSPEFAVSAIVFVLFGGTATILGPILGVLIFYGIYNAVGISMPQYFQLIYGLLIMALVLFLPNGLVSLLRRRGIDVP